MNLLGLLAPTATTATKINDYEIYYNNTLS